MKFQAIEYLEEFGTTKFWDKNKSRKLRFSIKMCHIMCPCFPKCFRLVTADLFFVITSCALTEIQLAYVWS